MLMLCWPCEEMRRSTPQLPEKSLFQTAPLPLEEVGAMYTWAGPLCDVAMMSSLRVLWYHSKVNLSPALTESVFPTDLWLTLHAVALDVRSLTGLLLGGERIYEGKEHQLIEFHSIESWPQR